jgi:hypothetical protein
MDQVFKYYLKSGENYYRIQNGVVLLDAIKTPLQHAPIDWQDTEISFERNLKYWGVFIENSLPFGFALDSAKILRSILYSDGVEADCTLYIEKLNTTTTIYEFYYQGTINFYTAVDEKTRFNVEILDKGVSGIIKSRQDTPVEVLLTPSNSVKVKLDGVLVRSNALFIPGQGDSDAAEIPINELTSSAVSEILNITYSGQQKAVTSFISPKSQEYGLISPSSGVFDYGQWLFRSNTAIQDVNFKGVIQAYTNVDDAVGGDYQYFIQIRVRRAGATILIENMYVSPQEPIDTDVYHEINIDHNLSIPLQTDDFVYVQSNFGGIGMATTKQTIYPTNKSILYVSYLAKVATSDCRVIAPLDLMNEVMSNISDGEFNVVSDFLSVDQIDATSRFKNWDNSPKWTRYTSGDSLRGLTEAKIKTTFFEPFKDLYAHHCLGMGVEGNSARVEPLKYFLSDTLIETIENNGDVIVSQPTDRFINQIKVGYENAENNNVVGKNEFNTGITFLPDKVKNAKSNEDDLVSPYNFGIYSIEAARAETLSEDKQDNRFDNETFGLELDPVPLTDINGIYYKVYRPSGTITGVDDPVNVYNVLRSPGRAERRHLPRTRSTIRKGTLVYQTTDKNPDLISTFGAGTVVETENINLESDTYNGHDVSRLFLPYVFEFDCPMGNLYNNVKNNPYGYIEFNFYGEIMKGFVLEVGMTPAKGICRCKLLSHPDNDESKLIR